MRLLNASGCLDALTAPEVARSLDAFVTKTVTPLPREGNEPLRIAEVEGGMLNAIGLANPGIDRFLTRVLPQLGRLEDVVAAVELNLSCPNVDEVPESVGEVVAAARAVTTKPLYTKLSPAVPDIAETARAAEAAGADGLSLVNTIRSLALDERTLRPVLARGAGGLSGPALRSIALAAVYACRRATALQIVGMGGVSTGRDALELLAVGANDVALGTVLFSDPAAPGRVRAELDTELAAHGFADADNAVGAAQAPDLPTLHSESRVSVEKYLHKGLNVAG